MPRIYSDIPKFKRIHRALIESVRIHDEIRREIDTSLKSSSRTKKEKELLRHLKRECERLRKESGDLTSSFYEAVMKDEQ